ncbi:hypothetical protein QIG17_27030, partial [Klebsiella pneumoniae]|nr:hypothetical protein [Klebsiella pneumoniae]
LLSDAEIYVKISSPTEQDFPEVEMRPILKGLQALRLFNISQTKQLLLSLFKARSKGTLTLADMNRAVLSIER